MFPKVDLLIMEHLKCTIYIMEIIYYIVKYILVNFLYGHTHNGEDQIHHV